MYSDKSFLRHSAKTNITFVKTNFANQKKKKINWTSMGKHPN